MDKVIRDFRNTIVKDIQESKLPLEVVRLVFVEVMSSVNAECEKVIAEQSKQEEKVEEEVENVISENDLG